MRDTNGAARNLYFVPSETGEMLPMVEAIIITSEPEFKLGEGGLERGLAIKTFRFHSSPDGLRIIADQFAKWADEADELAKKSST